MKTFLKTLATGLFSVALLALGGAIVSANDHSSEDLKAKIAELREAHQELKTQVEDGDLTKEEAKTEWKEMIAEVRAEKEAHFKARQEKIQAKYKDLLEKNPERAGMLKERMDAAQDRRETHKEKRAEIKTQIESGEITKEEAHKMKKESIDVRKKAREAFKAENKGSKKEPKGAQKMPAPAE